MRQRLLCGLWHLFFPAPLQTATAAGHRERFAQVPVPHRGCRQGGRPEHGCSDGQHSPAMGQAAPFYLCCALGLAQLELLAAGAMPVPAAHGQPFLHSPVVHSASAARGRLRTPQGLRNPLTGLLHSCLLVPPCSRRGDKSAPCWGLATPRVCPGTQGRETPQWQGAACGAGGD